MQSLNRILHAILSWFSISVFFILVVDVVLGVLSRYLFASTTPWVTKLATFIFSTPLRWTEELATFLLIWLVFCGAAIAYDDKAHLGINLLMEKFDPNARKVTRIVSLLIVLIFTCAVMIWGGAQLVIERFDSDQMMSTLGIHKAWQYLAIPFNGFFIAWFNLSMIIETIQSDGTQADTEIDTDTDTEIGTPTEGSLNV